MAEISEILNEFINKRLNNEKIYSDIGVVSDVNKTDKTCTVTPISGDAPRLEVKYFPLSTASGGILLTPSDGSTVAYSYTSPTDAFICLFGEVDDIVFQGGANDGLVKVNDLITKLNNLESDLNTLKTAFSSWVVAPTDGGAALKTITSTWYGSSITPTIKADLENNKFKH